MLLVDVAKIAYLCINIYNNFYIICYGCCYLP